MRLHRNLAAEFPGHHSNKAVHVRCVAHVIDISIYECMRIVHNGVEKIRNSLNRIRASVKLRDIFEAVRVELNILMTLPCLDVDTRWYKTFTMIHKADQVCCLLEGVAERVPELQEFNTREADWDIRKISATS